MFPEVISVLWQLALPEASSTIREAASIIAPRWGRQSEFQSYSGIGWVEPAVVAMPEHNWMWLDQRKLLFSVLRVVIWLSQENYTHCFAFAPMLTTAYHTMRTLNQHIMELSRQEFQLTDVSLDLRKVAEKAKKSMEKGGKQLQLRSWEIPKETGYGRTLQVFQVDTQKPNVTYTLPTQFEEEIASITIAIDEQEFVLPSEHGFELELFKAEKGPDLLERCTYLCGQFIHSVADCYEPRGNLRWSRDRV